ncbi:MAG: hypothetical protein AB7T48_02900 [Solirubrobacterales bacterium]
MSQRAAILAFAAALLLATALPAVASASLRFVSPHTDQFFGQRSVAVVVRGGEGEEGMRARLNGRDVSAAFKRVAPGRWLAQLGGGSLRSGANNLSVSVRGKGGHREYRSQRFVVGKRRHDFLTVVAPRRTSGSVGWTVRTRRRADLLLRATLDGKGISYLLDPGASGRQRLRLGADDGLHFGSNVLRVVAARRDGSFDVERRTIFVPRSGPLVGAGPDRRAAGRNRVRLDGTSSRATQPGATLSYRWRVVDRPRGSKARPRRAGTARAAFRPDALGGYRLRLTVSEHRRDGSVRSGSDILNLVDVLNAKPIGVPIQTMVFNGGNQESNVDTGIRVGGETFWLGIPQGNDVQVLFLDRSTLKVVYNASFPGTKAQAEAVAEKVKEYGSRVLVVMSNPELLPNMEVQRQWMAVIRSLGASTKWLEADNEDPAIPGGWTVVGIPASKNGAWVGEGSNPNVHGVAQLRGALSGYLQLEGHGNYTYVPRVRAGFDTSAPGSAALRNAIAIGAAKYESTPLAGCGSGGFQVEVVLAETLAPVDGQTFTTNGCGSSADTAAQQQMASYLNGIQLVPAGLTEGKKLVFVQSIGEPRDEAATGWNELTSALERLGATGSVFAADKGSYALVGNVGISAFPLVEGSSTLTGNPARATGILRQERRGSFVPSLSGNSGEPNFKLSLLAYQPAQAWPLSEGKEAKAALAYASEYLKLPRPTAGSACYVVSPPDVRSEYCDSNLRTSWAGYATSIERAPYVSGKGFSEELWKEVRNELKFEFNTVQQVWAMTRALQGVFGASEVGQQVELNALASTIERAINPPKYSRSTSSWFYIVSGIANLASFFTAGNEDLASGLGIFSGAIWIGEESIEGIGGSPQLEKFEIKAEEVAVELAKKYRAASGALNRVAALIVSDYGKLKGFSEEPEFGFNTTSIETLSDRVEVAGKQFVYQSLLPTAYWAVDLAAGERNNPVPAEAKEYECEYDEAGPSGPVRGVYNPYHPVAGAQFFSAAPKRSLSVLSKAGAPLPSDGGEEEEPLTPPQSVMEPLFRSFDEKGLEMFKPWFWRSAFEYPGGPEVKTVTC